MSLPRKTLVAALVLCFSTSASAWVSTSPEGDITCVSDPQQPPRAAWLPPAAARQLPQTKSPPSHMSCAIAPPFKRHAQRFCSAAPQAKPLPCALARGDRGAVSVAMRRYALCCRLCRRRRGAGSWHRAAGSQLTTEPNCCCGFAVRDRSATGTLPASRATCA